MVGESGCGKSVTSYSMLRLIQSPGKIVGGEILFHRDNDSTIDIAQLTEADDLLFQLRGGLASMIFQEPMTALSPVHTIGNQICEAILLHQDVTQTEAEEMAIAMLGKVGIPGPEKRLLQYLTNSQVGCASVSLLPWPWSVSRNCSLLTSRQQRSM